MTSVRARNAARGATLLPALATLAALAAWALGCSKARPDERLLGKLVARAGASAPSEIDVWAGSGTRRIGLGKLHRIRLGTSDRESVVTTEGVSWELPLGAEPASLEVSFGAVAAPLDTRADRLVVELEENGESWRLLDLAVLATDAWRTRRLEVPAGEGKRHLTFRSSGPTPIAWAELYRQGESATERPNLIFVIIDTLRSDHLSAYGYARKTSPELDRFARGALLFRNAFSAATWTLPSTASLMTGLYPDQHGVLQLPDVLPPTAVTLAERLRALGYRTAAFTDGGFVDPEWGFAQGFDRYDSTRGPAWEPKDVRKVAGPASRWISSVRTAPYFLFVHTYEVHQPYLNSEGLANAYLPEGVSRQGCAIEFPSRLPPREVARLVALYDGEIRRADRYLAEVWRAIATSPGAPRTAILVTSDHGEEFQEHGNLDHGLGKVFDENVRVPLILKLPEGKTGTIETPASGIDVLPTFLDLAGAGRDEIAALPGRSLLPIAEGKPVEPREILIEGSNSFYQLRERRYRLDQGSRSLVFDSMRRRAQVFDRARDPGMRNARPANGTDAPLVARLQAALGWLGGPYSVRLPDEVSGLMIPPTSRVAPLAVWDGLDQRSPPQPRTRRALVSGRAHLLIFALRPGHGELTLRLFHTGRARPELAHLVLAAPPPRQPPFLGPLPSFKQVVAGLGLGRAGTAHLNDAGLAELRALGYLR
ncbi:MAG TPA: sulfatase [Thermoanaerobaculia bacterium]|nr:sulfatase [Thermoanaerobaculia bacterium]